MGHQVQEVIAVLKQLQIRPGLRVTVTEGDREFAAYAASQVCRLLETKPDAVLGLPTGSTPVDMYAELVRQHRAGTADFSQVRTFNLDEYVGLAPSHPQSYRYFMQQHLFSHVNLPPGNTHIPSGIAKEPEKEALRYEGLLETLGPVDLLVLGLGTNGHIGFNEPGTPFSSITHVAALTPATIEANARFFASIDEVPRQAITMVISCTQARTLPC
jgi:glucosamine-6-phosphate deaminase